MIIGIKPLLPYSTTTFVVVDVRTTTLGSVEDRTVMPENPCFSRLLTSDLGLVESFVPSEMLSEML